MSRKQKGFTLVELVAVIALLVVVSSLIFSVFISGSNLYSYGLKIENVETNGRQVMQQLSQGIKTSKVLIGTKDLKDSTGDGAYIISPKYLDNTAIARTDLVAYVENYNNKRYIYALRDNGNWKKGLYEITLQDQIPNQYEIITGTVEQKLNSTDKDRVDPAKSSQEVLDSSYAKLHIDNYTTGGYIATYLSPLLMYDNNGDDCYLVATKGTEQVKLKLEEVHNWTTSVVSEKLIANYIDPTDSIIIVNKETNGEIEINMISGSMKKTIKTSVNIINKK